MKNSCFIVLFLLGIIPSAFAQLIGFEEEVPEAFKVSGKGEVKISSLFYKEGESSLEWDFQSGSTLDVQIAPLSLNTRNEKQFGITLWIYNEKPQQVSVRFEFLNKEGEVSYWFSYRLQAAGWRACWISFAYMNGDKKDKNIVVDDKFMLEIENHLKEDALRIEKDETELNNAWHKMSIFDRESSIAQSLHQDVKRWLVYDKKAYLLKDNKEELERIEHRRWNVFMITRGFKYEKAGKKDLYAKTHPCISKWEVLKVEKPDTLEYDYTPYYILKVNK